MKKNFLLTAACILNAAIFFSCDNAIKDSYKLCAPTVPQAWSEILGQPEWRFEWIDPDGVLRHAESSQNIYNTGIFSEGTSFALAYPFWPKHNIPSGIMKPAGALFPFDVQNQSIILSWQGGIDANFYRAIAAKKNKKNQKYNPQNFDWLRFRALWKEAKLGEEILLDGWRADWELAAEKTALSGFSVWNIKPRETENLIITLPASGPWFGSSPFAKEFTGNAGEKVVFHAGTQTDTYFCPTGQIRVALKIFSWILRT